jgi:intracellular septation protein A
MKRFPLWVKLLIDGSTPSLIYYIFYVNHYPLWGAIIATSWGVGVTILGFIRSRQLNFVSLLGTSTVVVELLTILLTRNSSVYLASYAINSALLGLVLLVSCLFERSLVQALLEQLPTFKERVPETVRLSRNYRHTMKRITAITGGLLLAHAGLLSLFCHSPKYEVIRKPNYPSGKKG